MSKVFIRQLDASSGERRIPDQFYAFCHGRGYPLKAHIASRLIFCLVVFITLIFSNSYVFCDAPPVSDNQLLKAFLDKVFLTMDEHYYLPVSRKIYDRFVEEYPAERLKILNQINKKARDFKHLGAGLLVNQLKSPSDKFTNFVPSEKSKAFKSSAYAVTEDLGIEGKKTKEGFVLSRVQKHSEAFEKGVRSHDTLLKIDGRSLDRMDELEINRELSPVVGTKKRLEIYFRAAQKTMEITLESKSYFKETVSVIPSGIPGVLVIKIEHFNQKTGTDFADELSGYGLERVKHLVMDLRDNGGGPPLAAREILGYFLPKDDLLFAIARKKMRPVMLTAPSQPLQYHGPVTLLINKKTGSAAEMFSGMMQAKKIADLVGEKTAVATYLKSIYDFEDGSLIFMITSLTFFYDRRVFPADGLTPDTVLAGETDGLSFVLDKIR